MDVNTLGAVTRTTPTGFLSNLVQRESLGGPTCMPIFFLFDFKNVDMAVILLTRMITMFCLLIELLLMMDRKSYMRFHLEPLSLTLSDIERSIQVTEVSNDLYLQIYSK